MNDLDSKAEIIASKIYNNFQKGNLTISELYKEPYKNYFKISNFKENVTVVIHYGKKGINLHLQGKNTTEFFSKIKEKINSEVEKTKNRFDEPESYIGVDESGKGDLFGPLVIAGFYLTETNRKVLIDFGIRDSKLMSDSKVKEIAKILRESFKENYIVVQINPKRYNELYEEMGNLNKILAWGHARCIETLTKRFNASKAISDQFGDEKFINNSLMKEGRQIELLQTTHGERYLAVATASILARDTFLNWIEKTSKVLGIKIQKGASDKTLEVARKIKERFGEEKLGELIKLHFKSVKKI